MESTDKIKKAETILGFALKARKIVIGSDNILSSRRKQSLILADNGMAQNSKKKLFSFAAKNGIPFLCIDTRLGELLHKPGVLAVSLNDKNMAEEIRRLFS
jgi:ribosomal protein L7Ae-like RNA K-turn-binding protein